MKITEELAAERNAATHKIYLQLHAARHAYPAKTLRTVLSELLYAEPVAWRAVGITRAALDAYHQAGKNKIQGIERAHRTDRSKMIEHILDRDEPMTQNDLFDYWRETDQVVIALKGENRSNTLGQWIPFENVDARYFPRLGIGFHYRYAIEGDLVRNLAEALSPRDRSERA